MNYIRSLIIVLASILISIFASCYNTLVVQAEPHTDTAPQIKTIVYIVADDDTTAPSAVFVDPCETFGTAAYQHRNTVKVSGQNQALAAEQTAKGKDACIEKYNLNEMSQFLLDAYSWNTHSDNWSAEELTLLANVGRDILIYIKSTTGDDGNTWIQNNLHTNFYKITGPRSFSLGGNILFNPDTIQGSKQFIAHELGHILENNRKNVCLSSICSKNLSKALINTLGGHSGLVGLFDNGPETLHDEYHFDDGVNATVSGAYGNSSTTEYFAEAFSWSIYDAELVHADVQTTISEMVVTLNN